MTSYVRGGAPRPVAAILGLMLLAAAATTRAAAIRGQPPAEATAMQGPTLPAPLAANNTLVMDVCAMKMEGGPPPRHADVDPLHKYLMPGDAAPLRGASHLVKEARYASKALLPAGCEDVGRVGHKMVRCSGANMTTLPDLSLERNLDSLVFVETGIQVVNDVSRLPRAVRTLTFARGPLVTFNGRRLYQVSGLETLSLEHNTLSTWSFVTAFYSAEAARNLSIRALYLQYNLITYPVSEPCFPALYLIPPPAFVSLPGHETPPFPFSPSTTSPSLVLCHTLWSALPCPFKFTSPAFLSIHLRHFQSTASLPRPLSDLSKNIFHCSPFSLLQPSQHPSLSLFPPRYIPILSFSAAAPSCSGWHAHRTTPSPLSSSSHSFLTLIQTTATLSLTIF